MKVFNSQWSALSLIVSAYLVAFYSSAQAQQSDKISKIGYLAGITAAAQSARIEAFREGLRELGYSEGKNIIIESRYAEGNADRVRSLAFPGPHVERVRYT